MDTTQRAPTKRVLLIDDMRSIRALVRVYLMNFGFTFDEASDGAEGLVRLSEHPADLIIVDLLMAGMGGVEFLEHLRARPQFAATPVIVLSASLEEVAWRGAGEVGPTYRAAKPIEPAALKRIVQQALGAG